MPEVFDWPAIDRLSTVVRCPWCASRYTSKSRGPEGRYYCHSCFRSFGPTAEIPYDVIADEWSPALAELQASGDLIAVHLGAGFYGVCLLTEASGVDEAYQTTPQRTGHAHRAPAAHR